MGLVVILLLMGGARHRVEPWLRRIAAPRATAEALENTAGSAPIESIAPPGKGAPAARAEVQRAPSSAERAVIAALADIDTERFGRVDLNRAGPQELESLPGIGPRLAQRIVEDREDHGPFTAVDDLDRVRGIGPRLLARIRDSVVIGAGESLATPAGTKVSTPPPALPK